MKSKFVLALVMGFSLIAASASAQALDFGRRSQIGVGVGVMNYSGYMNMTAFTLKEAHPSFELFYRYDVLKNFNVRADFMYGSLSKDNGPKDVPGGAYRPGQFKTNIFEASILPEYNFLDLSAHKVSPYIFLGGGYYALTGYQRNGQNYSKPSSNGLNFRGGVGVRYQPTPSLQVFLEGSRREFSHSIDFYESTNSPSRYYSIMIGASFRLSQMNLQELW